MNAVEIVEGISELAEQPSPKYAYDLEPLA
jgi:hypothetical protein